MKRSLYGPLVAAATLLVAILLPASAANGTGGGGSPGGGWLLGGSAQLAQDPENPQNDVIRMDTRCTDVINFTDCYGTLSRAVNVKVDKLDNMLEFKAWFDSTLPTPKSCVGGSPRVQLAIDTNGDGTSDGNAFGYFGASPNFTGCPMNTWLYEDLTGPGDVSITGPMFPSTGYTTPNEELEWDLTQFGGPFYNTWSQVETFFAAQPQHLVCSVALVDDTFGAPAMSGVAYYDLVSGGRSTWIDRSNISGRGFASGCGRQDHGDNDDQGDHDRDHEHNQNDEHFDNNRHEHWGDH